MPPKRDRRHDNPGRPPLKVSERQAARETKLRMSVASDRAFRNAAAHAGLGLNEWLKGVLEYVHRNPELVQKVKADLVMHHADGSVTVVETKKGQP